MDNFLSQDDYSETKNQIKKAKNAQSMSNTMNAGSNRRIEAQEMMSNSVGKVGSQSGHGQRQGGAHHGSKKGHAQNG